jgi:hypothetical protein
MDKIIKWPVGKSSHPLMLPFRKKPLRFSTRYSRFAQSGLC